MNFANRRGKSRFDMKTVFENAAKLNYQLNNFRSNIQPDMNSILPWCQLNGIGMLNVWTLGYIHPYINPLIYILLPLF